MKYLGGKSREIEAFLYRANRSTICETPRHSALSSVDYPSSIPAAAKDAALLIHEASYNRIENYSNITGKVAGRNAQKANATKRVLTNIQPRDGEQIKQLKTEAEDLFDGDVRLTSDGDSVNIPVPEANAIFEPGKYHNNILLSPLH